MPKATRIPPPPNDGRSHKFVDGKYVAVDKKQSPPTPASQRRAMREAEAVKAAESGTEQGGQMADKSGGKTASKRG